METQHNLAETLGKIRETLRKAFGNLYSEIELVEADLLKVESLSQAIKGCDYVVHIASPNLFKEPKDENLIIRPALEGTMAIL